MAVSVSWDKNEAFLNEIIKVNFSWKELTLNLGLNEYGFLLTIDPHGMVVIYQLIMEKDGSKSFDVLLKDVGEWKALIWGWFGSIAYCVADSYFPPSPPILPPPPPDMFVRVNWLNPTVPVGQVNSVQTTWSLKNVDLRTGNYGEQYIFNPAGALFIKGVIREPAGFNVLTVALPMGGVWTAWAGGGDMADAFCSVKEAVAPPPPPEPTPAPKMILMVAGPIIVGLAILLATRLK